MRTKVQVKFGKVEKDGTFDILYRISLGPAWLGSVSVEENLERADDASLPVEWTPFQKVGTGQRYTVLTGGKEIVGGYTADVYPWDHRSGTGFEWPTFEDYDSPSFPSEVITWDRGHGKKRWRHRTAAQARASLLKDIRNYLEQEINPPDPDDLPEVDAEDLESHGYGTPDTTGEVCDECGEPECYRACDECGHTGLVIDCGHSPQPTEIAWCHDTRKDLCRACWDILLPHSDELPEVAAEDLESHSGEVRTVRRAWVSGVSAEVEDCGNGHYDVILRADHGEDLLHFVGGNPEEGAVHATFSLEEVRTLAALFLSFPALSEVLRSPSLHPAPPPTPGRGGAREGEDGAAITAASDLMADLARENMLLVAEVESRIPAPVHLAIVQGLQGDIKALRAEVNTLRGRALHTVPVDEAEERLTNPGITRRPQRADGRRRWGNALWAVACKDLQIGDIARDGTKWQIWLDDEEEALVRLWVDDYRADRA